MSHSRERRIHIYLYIHKLNDRYLNRLLPLGYRGKTNFNNKIILPISDIINVNSLLCALKILSRKYTNCDLEKKKLL